MKLNYLECEGSYELRTKVIVESHILNFVLFKIMKVTTNYYGTLNNIPYYSQDSNSNTNLGPKFQFE